jgi:hypothetical protein
MRFRSVAKKRHVAVLSARAGGPQLGSSDCSREGKPPHTASRVRKLDLSIPNSEGDRP